MTSSSFPYQQDGNSLILTDAFTGEKFGQLLPLLNPKSTSKATPITTLDFTNVTRYDSAGVAFLYLLRQAKPNINCCGVSSSVEAQLRVYQRTVDTIAAETSTTSPTQSYIGRWASSLKRLGYDLSQIFIYFGEVLYYTCKSWFRPRLFNQEAFRITIVKAGTQAMPVVALVGFLLGVILAFQSAIPLKMFGGEIYVGGLVGLALVRELGPIITAILITGRSGSAFSAELGSMKVNEELDALETMGLSPVRFLAVPRIWAGTLVMPLLSLVATGAGLVGGWLVMTMMSFPLVVYLNQLKMFVSTGDLIGALAKSLVFGFAVSAVGCYCGLSTGRDAEAVGTSTTRAVVTGIVVVAILDGLFAILFSWMGW